MARVDLDNITKIYTGPKRERIEALRGVSLDIAAGEFVVILGPSGCGKTTTLRLIAGLEEPSSGAISIGGKSMNHVEPQDRDVAMVFQQPALYPHMTAFGNMAFGLKLRKLPVAQIEQRVGRMADMLGISTLLDRLPRDLSGGERQRVSIGRALVREPKVVLLDEPFTNLDAPLRSQLREEVVKLHRRLGTTMILVTHDQAEAMAMADRVAVMQSGQVRQVGDPRTICEHPANDFVTRFLRQARD